MGEQVVFKWGDTYLNDLEMATRAQATWRACAAMETTAGGARETMRAVSERTDDQGTTTLWLTVCS